MAHANTIDSLFKKVEKSALNYPTVQLSSIIDALNSRGFGPLICFLSLVMILPTGAIPGMPIIMGVLISLITVQLIAGRRTPWIPAIIKNVTVKSDSLKSGMHKAKPSIDWMLQYTHKRLDIMVSKIGLIGIAILCTLLALSMIPLGVIPFLVMVPASLIFLFGVAITTHDGLLVIIGMIIMALCAAFIPFVL